jgi:hypothetical protein
MASFECIGLISQIVYRNDNVFLYLDEFHKGYKKSDGTKIDDKYITYKVIYKPYFKKYFANHFAKGMLVKVKGEVFPYVIEHGKVLDSGMSIIGDTCNMYSYPRASVKQEMRMIKDSQEMSDELPDIDNFNAPDFAYSKS